MSIDIADRVSALRGVRNVFFPSSRQLDAAELRKVHTIISHENCADGVASALILSDALPKATVRLLHYDSSEHRNLAAVPGMLFCDFTPPRDRVADFVSAGAFCLDHHVSQRAITEAFGDRGVYVEGPGISGAVLAWWDVWGLVAPDPYAHEFFARLAILAGVRDTWQRHDQAWSDACAQSDALVFWPLPEWLRCLRLSHGRDMRGLDALMATGPALRRKRDLETDAMSARAVFRVLRESRPVLVAIVPSTDVSDVADALLADARVDMVAGFALKFDPVDGTRLIVSMRTRGRSDMDLSKLAAYHGGGGHRSAAGFSVKPADLDRSRYNKHLGNPYLLVPHLLEHSLCEGPTDAA